MYKAQFLVFLTLCCSGFGLLAQLSEDELQQEIKSSLNFGEMRTLGEGTDQFYGLYADTDRREREGGVLLLHGIAGNPDEKPLWSQLRRRLAQRGWSTLSLQLPPVALLDDWSDIEGQIAVTQTRIQAGIAFFNQNQIEPITIIAEGPAAMAAAQLLTQSDQADVLGLVIIDWPVDAAEPVSRQSGILQNLELPILDVYSWRDTPLNKQVARQRRVLMREHASYRQHGVVGSPKETIVNSDILVEDLIGWIKRLPRDWQATP